ncbi:hypothetical protein [Amycolatopsis alba]|uniref:Uncharacterized protein n=1 Tax=Amycolatopsis alba DSM 44262 TaxID=1125972 RepID=A0A229RFZ8_AMYAL|nr:hypothetical protein [Amycolatopsis alba]OXM45409.1 hypothetical protein CFP75_31165 [Amycolatopsis alba DSM 44262]
MRVLLTEAVFGDADDVGKALRELGCRVSTCHSRAGLCRALAPGGRCPFDEADAPDLAVDVRSVEPELTTREFGVICALRARVPVILTPAPGTCGPMIPPGLESRVVTADGEELIEACRGFLRSRTPAV